MELTQRVAAALHAAHHPDAQQHDRIQCEGFAVEARADGGAEVRWVGGDAADPVAVGARRFFVARYADTLDRAGIHAELVEGAGEPYLLCRRQ